MIYYFNKLNYNKIMRVPIRKPGKYTHNKKDPHITEEKFLALKKI